MQTHKSLSPSKNTLGWVLFAAGLLLILTGIALRIFVPGSAINPKWFESFGIFFAAASSVYLVRFFQGLRNPLAARRASLNEEDERARSIRDRAGSAAFTLMIVLSGLALLIYSNLTANRPGFDPIWAYLAGMVIVPVAFYIAALIWLNQRS